jgi:hypothetical protein
MRLDMMTQLLDLLRLRLGKDITYDEFRIEVSLITALPAKKK